MVNIEKYDNLPFKEGMGNKYKTNWKSRDWWGYPRSRRYHKVNGIWPSDRVRRIIKNNIGKSFADAFSYYCSKVPKYQQKYFLKEFEESNSNYYYYDQYYVDDNGLIQIANSDYKRSKTISIISDDYKTEERHKVTGHKELDFEAIYEKIPRIVTVTTFVPYKYITEQKTVYDRGNLLYYRHKTGYIARDEDFEHVTIKGWIKYFTSRNDPQFIKLWNEKLKARKKAKRLQEKKNWDLLLKDNTIKCYNNIAEFKRKQQEQIKREEELNKQTIIRHGFDPITSFRN